MSSAISLQLSAINRRLHRPNHRSVPCIAFHSKLLFRSGERSGFGSQTKTTLNYTPHVPGSHIAASAKSLETTGDTVNIDGTSAVVPDNAVVQPVRAAKIHDFCLGIPFGGLVLSGGIAGFLFTRNPTTLSTGLFFGGALLALSTLSLKIWRQGKSSLPFMLGQAGIAAALIWKNFHAYSLTKKMFPTGFYAVISAAMLCFYSYVMMSGGNPPPKKLKTSVAAAAS